MCARVNFFLDTEIHKYTERESSTDDDDDDCLFRDASVTLTVFFSKFMFWTINYNYMVNIDRIIFYI